LIYVLSSGKFGESMTLLLGFLPFAVFAVGDRFGSTLLALSLATVTAAVLALRDVKRGRSVKLLDLGATVLFGGLALYTVVTHTEWSMLGVRLCTDAGLFGIVGVSLVVRHPFTLQYAREQLPEASWTKPEFVRTN
jgi:hypothetical protein